MKLLTTSIILIIFFSANTLFGQSKKVRVIVDRIIKINQIQYEQAFPFESENYQNYLQLRKVATIKELVLLTDNINETVACYASWALADKNYINLKKIFQKFIVQDRTVELVSDCLISQVDIESLLYYRYQSNVDILERPTDKILLELDSIVLFSEPSHWLLLSSVLENRLYSDFYKEQISTLAFEEGKRDAILYLCNWHKAEYLEQLKVALIKYLNETDFSYTGANDYYMIVNELFKFNDSKIRETIIAKMKKDRYWELEKERFKYLLLDNSIYNLYNE